MTANRLPMFLLGLLLGSWTLAAHADTWAPPSIETHTSANGESRAIIVPRAIKGPLAYFEDKVEGVEPAGQARGAPARSPVARVERLQEDGSWKLLWVRPLVNDVAPPSALIADDGSFLVTFDNWHSAGFGDDVVVIYDRHGELVRKLSLEQILPAAYVPHLPRSVSSRWWGGKHRLVESDAFVELQVVEPGAQRSDPVYVGVRIRLADGSVVPPSGPAWEAAMAKANALEAERMAAWDAARRLRLSSLTAPTGKDTRAWQHYVFEIRDRLADADEKAYIGGAVLAAPGEEPGFHSAKAIALQIGSFEAGESYGPDTMVFASPTSGRLADVLVKAFGKRDAGSMKGFGLVFVGTAADGQRVAAAAQRAGAAVSLVDVALPAPAGTPLPETPPPLWMPRL